MYTRFLSVALTFAIALSSLGYVNSASAQRVKNCDPEAGPVHPSCKDDTGDGDGGGRLRVDVTFEDASTHRLMSDCAGGESLSCPYEDKQQKVGAGIGNTGNLALSLTKGNQVPIRLLFVNFEDCNVAGVNCPVSLASPGGFTVGPVNFFTSGVNMLGMTTDETAELALVVSLNLNSEGEGGWRIHFGTYADCSEQTLIDVTRIGDDEWEIEATSTDLDCLVKGGDELRGLYNMPFKMTVKKQP